jgi:hypothetical protein
MACGAVSVTVPLLAMFVETAKLPTDSNSTLENQERITMGTLVVAMLKVPFAFTMNVLITCDVPPGNPRSTIVFP